MKKVLGTILILLAIASFGFGAYYFINTEMIVSEQNNVLYDGFNESYNSGRPNSRRTLFIYLPVIGSLLLGSTGIEILKKKE